MGFLAGWSGSLRAAIRPSIPLARHPDSRLSHGRNRTKVAGTIAGRAFPVGLSRGIPDLPQRITALHTRFEALPVRYMPKEHGSGEVAWQNRMHLMTTPSGLSSFHDIGVCVRSWYYCCQVPSCVGTEFSCRDKNPVRIFYADLLAFSDFEEITDLDKYSPLPDDWDVSGLRRGRFHLGDRGRPVQGRQHGWGSDDYRGPQCKQGSSIAFCLRRRRRPDRGSARAARGRDPRTCAIEKRVFPAFRSRSAGGGHFRFRSAGWRCRYTGSKIRAVERKRSCDVCRRRTEDGRSLAQGRYRRRGDMLFRREATTNSPTWKACPAAGSR